MSVQPYLTGLEHEERKRDLSQFFTPSWLAKMLWRWCPQRRAGGPWRILEPAAGTGSLVVPMMSSVRAPDVVAYELDPDNIARLAQVGVARPNHLIVRPRDFLAQTAEQVGRFDLSVMNPPYEDDQDVEFILHALECAPQAIGLFSAAIVYSDRRWTKLWRWVDIRRKAELADRPDFGGPYSPQTNFCALDLEMRKAPRRAQEPLTHTTEWWRRAAA